MPLTQHICLGILMPPAPRNPFDVLSVMSINPSLDLAKMKFELSAIEANPFPCRRPSTIEPTYNLRLNDVPLSDDAWEFSPFSGEWNCERTSFLICRNSIFCDLLCLKSSHHITPSTTLSRCPARTSAYSVWVFTGDKVLKRESS